MLSEAKYLGSDARLFVEVEILRLRAQNDTWVVQTAPGPDNGRAAFRGRKPLKKE